MDLQKDEKEKTEEGERKVKGGGKRGGGTRRGNEENNVGRELGGTDLRRTRTRTQKGKGTRTNEKEAGSSRQEAGGREGGRRKEVGGRRTGNVAVPLVSYLFHPTQETSAATRREN